MYRPGVKGPAMRRPAVPTPPASSASSQPAGGQSARAGKYPRGPPKPQAPVGRGKTGLPLRPGTGAKRHQRKLAKDTIRAITKGDMRRMARRGGIQRISATIYEDTRTVLKERLELILEEVVAIVEYRQRQTVTLDDVLYTLRRMGRPVWGFDKDIKANSRANLFP